MHTRKTKIGCEKTKGRLTCWTQQATGKKRSNNIRWGPHVLFVSSCVWYKATNEGIFVLKSFLHTWKKKKIFFLTFSHFIYLLFLPFPPALPPLLSQPNKLLFIYLQGHGSLVSSWPLSRPRRNFAGSMSELSSRHGARCGWRPYMTTHVIFRVALIEREYVDDN